MRARRSKRPRHDSHPLHSDDVGFVRQLLAALERDYRIDPRRVYATGLSRGGFFALRLAADPPERFAAHGLLNFP